MYIFIGYVHELYMAFAAGRRNISPWTKEVLNYRKALWYGYGLVLEKKLITTNDLTRIHGIILENDAGIRTQSGTQLKDALNGRVVYTPPQGEGLIRDLMEIPILYLSSYIINRKSDYYRLLREVRENNNWTDWILYILDGVEKTATQTSWLIRKIRALMDETGDRVKAELPSIYSRDLIETIFEQPYCRVAAIVNKGLYERRTAMKYLRELERNGIFRSVPAGKQVLFPNTGLYELLRRDH